MTLRRRSDTPLSRIARWNRWLIHCYCSPNALSLISYCIARLRQRCCVGRKKKTPKTLAIVSHNITVHKDDDVCATVKTEIRFRVTPRIDNNIIQNDLFAPFVFGLQYRGYREVVFEKNLARSSRVILFVPTIPSLLKMALAAGENPFSHVPSPFLTVKFYTP